MSRLATRCRIDRAHGRDFLVGRRATSAPRCPGDGRSDSFAWKIGATSLVKVGRLLIARLLIADCDATDAPADGHLHLRVGPAAVIAEVAGRLARSVVDDRLQDVFARLAEGRGRHRLAAGQLGLRRRRTARRPGPRNFVQNTVSPTGSPRRFGRSVVGGRKRERGAGAGLVSTRCDGHDRRQVRADLLAVAAARRPLAIDLPHRLQRGDDLLGLAVRGQLPDELSGRRTLSARRP